MTHQFANYHSLDLQNKLYQVKALKLAQTVLQPAPSPQILDLGCADSSFLKHTAKFLKAQPHGLDINFQSKIITQFDLNSNQNLPYSSNLFSLVFALEIIEHLQDTDFFLQEIHRLLKPKGYLILSTPNLASLKNRLRLILGLYPQYLEYSREGAGHIHLYTPATLTNQIKKHHLNLIKLTSPNIPCPAITNPAFPKLIRELAIKLGDFLPTFSSHLIILAQK